MLLHTNEFQCGCSFVKKKLNEGQLNKLDSRSLGHCEIVVLQLQECQGFGFGL